MAFTKYLLHTGEYRFHSSIRFADLRFVGGSVLLDHVLNQVEAVDESDAMPTVFDRQEDALAALKRRRCFVQEDPSTCGYEITASIPFVEQCLCDEDMTAFDGSQDIWNLKTLAVAEL